MNRPLLEATSPRLAVLAAKLGKVGVRPERPIKHGPPLVRDGKGPLRAATFEEIEDWFWNMNALIPETGCWEWQGRRSEKGYGTLAISCRCRLAHRVACRLVLGRYPELLCCHTCDNPPCCNPSHLFLGSVSDNALDAVQKGRVKAPCYQGQLHPRSKLTDSQVLEMRSAYASADRQELALKYGVSKSTIQAILDGRTWRHL